MGLQTFPDDTAVPSQTGNSGKYLTTNGSAASWGTVSAGAMTLIQNATGSASSFAFTSIPNTYKHLKVIGNWAGVGGSDFPTFTMTGAQYSGCFMRYGGSTKASLQGDGTNYYAYTSGVGYSWELTIANYNKLYGTMYTSISSGGNGAWNGGGLSGHSAGVIYQNAAISGITFYGGSGAYNISLYGMS